MTNFDDQWGPCSKHLSSGLQERTEAGYSLPQLANCNKQRCDSWMRDLLDEYKKLENQSSAFSWSNQVEQKNIVLHWVNELYKRIEQYSESFNLQLCDSNLRIHHQEPAFHRVECERESCNQSVYRDCVEAHFATRSTALVIRGIDKTLIVYFVPVEMLLGIELDSIHSCELTSILELEPFNRTQATVASTNEFLSCRIIDLTELSILARKLFCELLRAEWRINQVN